MTPLLLELWLAFQLATLGPVRDPLAHVRAAQDAAGEDLPVELLLAIAWWESGYQQHPITHHCGVMMVAPQYVSATCSEMRELAVGYAMGAEVLRRWRRLSGGAWREAIRGYRCGGEGLRTDCPQEPGYDDKVLATAERYGWRPPSTPEIVSNLPAGS